MDLPNIAESKQLFKEPAVAQFHEWYRSSNKEGPSGPPWARYRGFVALKNPMDLWIYQEIISENNIGSIVECGTAGGGTTLFLADICEAVGRGHVVSVDLDENLAHLPQHPLIDYVRGDTISTETIDKTLHVCYSRTGRNQGNRLLILDDSHSHEHVEQELILWTSFLSSGDWLIVEDTNIGGPYWGLQAFMRNEPDGAWILQEWCEKFGLTFNPMGYWRKR
jgi:cephalosporin hydroxylase